MMKTPISFEGQSPNKNYLTFNISELLNRKIVASPQATLGKKFSSYQSSKSLKHFDSSRRIQNHTQQSKRQNLKINYQHYRIKSSQKSRSHYNLMNQQQDFNRSEKLNFDRHKLFIDQLSTSPSVKGVGLQNSYKSLQIQPTKSIKNKNFAFREQLYATSHIRNGDQILIMSLEFKKKISSQSGENLEHSNKENLKKRFLKKGSSLQRQIVTNLLRNKLMKEHEHNIKKQYTQKDILGMIKLYKGFSYQPPAQSSQHITKSRQKQRIMIQTKSSPEAKSYRSVPSRKIEKSQKRIQGWEIQPEFQLQLKTHQDCEITMDRSSQPQ